MIDIKPIWQVHAITAYQHTPRASTELAAWIERLTGRTIGLDMIVADDHATWATTVVDGVRFRLDRPGLTVVRTCIGCGVSQLESPPISGAADLGYALSAWEPRCRHCPAEDPVGWLEQEP